MSADPNSRDSVSRRRFLVGGMAGVAAIGLAACSKSSPAVSRSSDGTVGGGTATTAAGGAGGDVKTAMTAAGLEVLAVAAYTQTLSAASAGSIGTVPPAVATFVQTAKSQHQTALDQWNGVITKAGGQQVTTPPADLKATVDQAFAQVKDVTAAAKLALNLEQTASDTYLAVGTTLVDKSAITLAGALQCAGQERAAILNFVLGSYPVPDVFQKVDKAYKG